LNWKNRDLISQYFFWNSAAFRAFHEGVYDAAKIYDPALTVGDATKRAVSGKDFFGRPASREEAVAELAMIFSAYKVVKAGMEARAATNIRNSYGNIRENVRSSIRANTGVASNDLAELRANGVKFTPENVVATGRNSSGQVIFLETGNSKAGLQHIVKAHGEDFAKIGIPEAKIPDIVMQAATQGKLVGYQGRDTGRPIYEIMINGATHRIAVTTGNNGFIVGANPAGRVK